MDPPTFDIAKSYADSARALSRATAAASNMRREACSHMCIHVLVCIYLFLFTAVCDMESNLCIHMFPHFSIESCALLHLQLFMSKSGVEGMMAGLASGRRFVGCLGVHKFVISSTRNKKSQRSCT